VAAERPWFDRQATLLHLAHVLRKRQMTVALFTVVLMLTVTIGTLVSTPFYRSAATVEISPNAPTVMGNKEDNGVVSVDAQDERHAYYATQYRILESRAVLTEAVRRLEEEHGVTDFQEEEDKPRALMTYLKIEPEYDTRLVNVVVEYPDAEKAALFANTVAQTYIDLNLQRAVDNSQAALKWLTEQQEKYRKKKYESDLEAHDFKYKNDLIGLTGSGDDNPTLRALNELNAQWSEVRTQRVQAEAAYDQLLQLVRSKRWSGVAHHLATTNSIVLGQLQTLQTKLEERAGLQTRYLADHPKLVQADEEIKSLETQVQDGVSQILDGQKAEIAVLREKEKRLFEDLEKQKEAAAALEKNLIQYNFLEADASKNANLFESLDQRTAEVDLSRLIEANNVWFIDRARADESPVRPLLSVNLPASLLVGLIVGMGLAFLIEYVDRTVKSREEVEDIIGVPFLGAVPLIDEREVIEATRDIKHSVFVSVRPKSTTAEALRGVRTNLLFRLPKKQKIRLLITSAAPREGKSFVSSNLSAIIAMTGHRVLLIDSDLRRPLQHKIFGLDNDRGLSTALLGEAPVTECIQKTNVPGLDVIPSGPHPENPAELLGSQGMADLLDSIQGYDVLVIDSSPIGAVADPVIVSRMVDGVVMVIHANNTNRDLVVQTKARLAEMETNILGAVVNKLDVRKDGYGYYYYYDYDTHYYDEEKLTDEAKKTG
jgi:polysaccharide biosynthesis transport protein